MHFDISGASLSQEMKNTKTLLGAKTFLLKRNTNQAIRGSISGIAGADKQDKSGDIYIPPYEKPVVVTPENPPQHLIMPLDGKIRKSIAYWSGGANSSSWDCIVAPDGFDLVVVLENEVNIGKRRGTCVGAGSFCNSLHESCGEVVIQKGCFVNKEWHDWYKARAAKAGIPISNETACIKG